MAVEDNLRSQFIWAQNNSTKGYYFFIVIDKNNMCLLSIKLVRPGCRFLQPSIITNKN